jgi:hypothetical protein
MARPPYRHIALFASDSGCYTVVRCQTPNPIPIGGASLLDAAQAAFDGGLMGVAINQLNAFVSEGSAQAGKFIVADHADHPVMHTQMAIKALGG